MRELSMEVEEVPIGALNPAPYNPRRPLPVSEKRALRVSLEEYGMVYPVVANRRTGNVVGGHQRLDMMRELGWETCPVVWVDMSDEQERRANIQLNSIESGWDDEALQDLLGSMAVGAIEDMGFTRVEAQALRAGIFMNRDSKQEMLDELRRQRGDGEPEGEGEPEEIEEERYTCPMCGYSGPKSEFGLHAPTNGEIEPENGSHGSEEASE